MEHTISSITNTRSDWTDILKSAAWLYKYPFQEQILIYAQRPDATACAPIELWNKTIQRWVNRGAKGIALIDDSAANTALKYVFDVSDTHNLYDIPFHLWEMTESYKSQIIEELAHQFGEVDEPTVDFENQLKIIIQNAVEDNYSDYYQELLAARENSFLEELDDLNINVLFKDALKVSISCSVFTRIGLSTDQYFSDDDFKGIYNFNTFDTVMQLGSATSDISEMVLRQIERTVKSIEKQERDRLAKFKYVRENINEGKERNDENGDHIHETRRLPDTQPDAERTGNETDREIRDAAEDLPQKPQERDILGASPLRKAGHPLGGHRPDSKRAGETDYGAITNDESGSRQSDIPDGLGGTHEQFETHGGGSSAERSDLQLNLLSEQEQIDDILQAEDEKSSAFSISQQNIDYVLLRGSGVEHGKIRIYQQFQRNAGINENIRSLKVEYGIGGNSVTFPDGSEGSTWHDAKGIRISIGRWGIADYDLLLSWPKLNKRIGELIETKRYMTQSEIDEIPVYEEWLLRRQQEAMEERAVSDAKLQQLQTAKIQGKYNLKLGSTVYVDRHEYDVLAIADDKILLYDPEYPLITQDMPNNEFIRKLQASTRNDYLLDLENVNNVNDVSQIKITLANAENNSEKPSFEMEIYQPEEELQPAWEKAKHKGIDALNSTVSDFFKQKINYRITDDALGHGGAKAKYGYNTTAVRTLKEIEKEHRLAEPEEQEILSKYVGWGGLPQSFDENSSGWSNEYAELKLLLTEDEYTSARESTLNAHYTSPTVVKAIYQALENMGFKTGNVLEPACGIGNFFGLVPESMKEVKLYGVELDSITGRIAQQLYQKANITIEGYEKTNLQDSFFDLAIGNVPFGSYGVADKRYDKNHFLIHDYFFAKTLDKVRPGGIIAFITSSGTLDKKNPAVRKYIAQRAELLGAIRLPNNAFLANAGTQVVADIIFFTKA